VIESVLVLAVLALALSLRWAFVRIESLEREVRAARPAGPRTARSPEADLPPKADLPLKGGSYQIERADRATEGVSGGVEPPELESLESRIGTQWLLYIGVIAIVIGVAYFEKLAVDNAWLGETARVIQGAVLGLVLTYAGLRFVRAGYAIYGQMVTGGGAAILYLSTYAAFNFYHLIDRPAAFVLMVGITAMVAWLADRQRSQGLALFAVGGGFGTPFLLPGTMDAQMALFGYDTVLIAGTMVLSARRTWPALNIVSYLFTMLTVADWADHFYTPDKYLRTEIFLTLFCAMFLYILRQGRQPRGAGTEASTMVLWTAPAAYYLASWIILQDHGTAFLVWLVALMLAGGILSDRAGAVAGFVVWLAVSVPLLLWTVTHAGPAWRVAGLVTIAGVYVIALAAQLRPTLQTAEPAAPGTADIVWLHLNGLLMFAGAYFLISDSHLAITGTVAAVFALWQGAIAALVHQRQRDEALHFAALGFTLLSIAIALQFDGPAVTIGWASEGAAVIALGLWTRRTWLRNLGVVLLVIAIGRALELLASERAVSEAVLFNPHAAAAAVIAALCYVLAWLHDRDAAAPDRRAAIGASLVTAQVVTLALLTSEIHAYWVLREGHFARELMVSVTWGVYATVLIVIGLRRRYAPIRYLAMIVFAITIVKVFALDLSELDRIYRISSVLGLGILLLLTSYLYSRSKRA
jgi:uncharacterized membrane protein